MFGNEPKIENPSEDERRKIIKRLYKKWHPDKNFGNELVTTEVFKFIKQAVLNIEPVELV
jgi:sacsin